MRSPGNRAVASVERFFQFAMLGLVTSGYFALLGTGSLDQPTLLITGLGLLLRALAISGIVRVQIRPQWISLAALCCVGFFAVDFLSLSKDFLLATIHGVCFLSVIKIVTASSNRDYIYTGAIAFLELVAAAVLSITSSFFLFLTLYILFSIAAFTSAEIRRGLLRHERSIPPPSARISWRLGLVAFASTAGILIITGGLFLLVPRTARAAAMLFPNAPRLTGFSNEINLGNFGEIGNDDRPVMHVQSYTKGLPVNLKWRGAAWSRFDGKKWSEPPIAGRELPAAKLGFASVADDWQKSRRDGRRVIYRVDARNADAGVLFVAGIPEFINVNSRKLFRTPEDSFRVLSTQGEALRYEVSAQIAQPLAYGLTAAERGRYLRLPPLNTRIWSLAREWAGGGTALERAVRIQNHLRNDFGYELRLPKTSPADPLSDFLFVRRKGHCEYFASAMAVMVRTLGIPSRMVSGFQSGYFNEVSGLYVIRGSDAHAWVEAYIDGMGWITFDPTPSSRNPPKPAGLFRRMDMYLDAVDNAWQEWVLSYDLRQQASLAFRFEAGLQSVAKQLVVGWATPREGWDKSWREGGKQFAYWALGLIGALVLAVFAGPALLRQLRTSRLIRRIRNQPGNYGEASVLYHRMLERLEGQGMHKPGFFTPAEFARNLPLDQSAQVIRFTEVYNRARFGHNEAATAELVELLQAIEQA